MSGTPRNRVRSAYDEEVALARKGKRVGVTREEYVTARRRAYELSAKAQGWQLSELAMSIADVEQAANKIFGLGGVQ
jgi:hypothetical protein